MARTLSSLVTTLKDTNEARTAHLWKIVTADSTTFRFTDLPESYTFGGATWLPYLLWDSAVRYSRGLEVDGGVVRLSNIDLILAQNLRDTDFEGATATLEKFFLDAEEAVTIFQGRVLRAEVTDQAAEFRLGGDLDPTGRQFPKRNYSALCPWRFKGAECGYQDGVDPNDPGTGQPYEVCPKDFDACTDRGRTHRFGGFVHVTREVTEAVEGTGAVPPTVQTPQLPPGSVPDWARYGFDLP